MFNKIRIGVLGCAHIAKRYVLPSLLDLDKYFILSGIASRTESKAKEFAELFNTESYTGYDSIISSGKIDAVYIPLPNSLHYEWIKKSLEKGLHVIIEKSLACEYKEVVELNNLAQKKRLVLLENFQFRFHRQLEFLNEVIKNGDIGELRNVRSSFGFPPFPDKNNIRYNEALGGGALLDAGAYPVKITQLFLGNDVSVQGASLSIDPIREVDIWGSAFLRQNNGKVSSQIAFGFDNHYQCNIELWGSKGKVTANRIFTAPPGYEAEIVVENSKGIEIIKISADNHFINMLKYFFLLITEKKNIEDEYKQNINQARLIKELRKNSNA